MSRPAPRSIDEYLKQLRAALDGEDPALIQDALYDAEEYLRAEIAAHPDKIEADVLELIASTYGAPDEVATAYRETEVKVKAALQPLPPRTRPQPADSGAMRVLEKFFAVFSDPRAYTSLFFMLLTLATGILYFIFAVTGLAMSLGLSVLIIGLPFFLLFVGMARVISLGEGRLLEAISGERMPRRPVHPGAPKSFGARIIEMLKDSRTWTTLLYFLLMLPLGILYFVFAIVGLSVGLSFIALPVLATLHYFGGIPDWVNHVTFQPGWIDTPVGYVFLAVLGVIILTALMHLARAIGRVHARMAKVLLVTQGA
jgi:putative sensor protein